MRIYSAECEAAGINEKELAKVARRLAKAAKDLDRMGCFVFGGSGSGQIRKYDEPNRPLILADLGWCGYFDGGDGGCALDKGGLMRGE